MKKIKLENMQSINACLTKPSSDGQRSHNGNEFLDESGAIDESGLIDNSGYIYDAQTGYEYVYAIVGAISVRYVIIWQRYRNNATASIALDDGTNNPYASGDLGEPITNTNNDNYAFVRQQINTVGITGTGSITSSWTIEYTYFPCGRNCTIGEECEPQYRYASGIIQFNIPPYQEEDEE